MYNLVVKHSAWSGSRDSILASRVFEYTEKDLIDRFQPSGQTDFKSLLSLPTLFVEEKSWNQLDQIVRVGTITRARPSNRDVVLDYTYDSTVPAFTNKELLEWIVDLDIDSSEFTRTHWAIKEADLFRVLLREMRPLRQKPRVFSITEPERIEPTLVSAMMPFHPSFDRVYATLQTVAASAGLRCRRADDIWENPAVIQDVVSLIDRSAIVICDCTGRNPNVFYEIGIAHTLGREVILITQSEADIPFDLRHLRYVSYLNNGEGMEQLSERLSTRLADLASQ